MAGDRNAAGTRPASSGPDVAGAAGAQPNLVLTGFMGTGKSAVGRLLAERLGRELVDTDELISLRFGPIPEIFARAGEKGFRQIERAVCGELAGCNGLVIATGGATMLDPANIAALTKNGDVVCLVADPATIAARVGGGDAHARPLLASPLATSPLATSPLATSPLATSPLATPADQASIQPGSEQPGSKQVGSEQPAGRGQHRQLTDAELRERISALLAERAEGYARFRSVDTSGLGLQQVADAVLAAVAGHPS